MKHQHQAHQHHSRFVFNAPRMLARYPISFTLVSPWHHKSVKHCHTKFCMLGDNIVTIPWKVIHPVAGMGVGEEFTL